MVRGIAHRRKRYVEVVARTDSSGNVVPLEIVWDWKQSFRIDRVLDTRRAASLKVGGKGTRYLVEISGSQTYLYYEDPAWFVEAKEDEHETVL